jgi:hypothetical protein
MRNIHCSIFMEYQSERQTVRNTAGKSSRGQPRNSPVPKVRISLDLED